MFMHSLGAAVADVLHNRVPRYDEELRRLDSGRAVFVRKLSKSVSSGPHETATTHEGGGAPNGGADFDLSHFFLVKESLAFTYEQMRLFKEAKLHYEELSEFLPEDAGRSWHSSSDSVSTRENMKMAVEEKYRTLPWRTTSTNSVTTMIMSGKDLRCV